jgi:hypothetical protein
MALKFPSRSFRVGTIKDSVYSISSTVEYIQDSGKAIVQDLGASPDGKSYYEWRIIPKNGMEPFAIYDYKLGVDPGDQDNFEEEFEFSIGGASKEAEDSAKAFGFNVVSEENINEADEDEADEDKDVEGRTLDLLKDLKSSLDPVEYGNYDEYEKSVMRDLKSNDNSRIDQYKTMDFKEMKEDYDNYIMDKRDLEEMFIRQMKFRAGIIK